MSAALQALVAGDFAGIARRLAAAGLRVGLPGAGVLRLSPASSGVRMQLLISVGVHGNETAPIAMLAPLLDALIPAPQALQVDLLIVVGNPPAIALGSRFVDADLNRMFIADRGALAAAGEAARADAIMSAAAGFFIGESTPRWHLDLHSAIRPSRYARFAVIPAPANDPAKHALTGWLGSAAIEAVIFNTRRASTFSAYTAATFGALSCTIELGQAGVLGQHPPEQLAASQAAVARLLRGEQAAAGVTPPARFRVAQEIIKRSDDFQMKVDRAAHNFTAMDPGTIIATDGGHVMRVGPVTEYVVFPNPKVLVGQRAGLMVVGDDSKQCGGRPEQQ